MTAPFPPPLHVDLLAQAIEHARIVLGDRATPVGVRLRDFWAAVVAARDLATSDIVENEFVKLANDVGLTSDLGRHAREDIEHVIRWASRDWNPFQ